MIIGLAFCVFWVVSLFSLFWVLAGLTEVVLTNHIEEKKLKFTQVFNESRPMSLPIMPLII